jgi:hypothetical protein
MNDGACTGSLFFSLEKEEEDMCVAADYQYVLQGRVASIGPSWG